MRRALFIGILLAPPSWAGDYVVKEGDTLSEIALAVTKRCPYGKDGSLRGVLELNAEIADPDRLRIGQVLSLPDFESDETSTTVSSDTKSSNPFFALSPPAVHKAEKPESGERVFIPSAREDRQKARSDFSAVRDPAQEEEEKKTPDGQPNTKAPPQTLLTAEPIWFFSRLDAKDWATQGTATLLSDLNYGLQIEARQLWGNAVHSGLTVGTSLVTMQPLPTKTLDKATQTVSHLGAYACADLGFGMELALEGRLQEILVVRGVSSSEMTLDKLVVPNLGVQFLVPIYTFKLLTLGARVGTHVVFSADNGFYSVRNGIQYEGSVYARHHLSSAWSLDASLFFIQTSTNTSISSQTEKDVGSSFRIGWSF